jgi:hypothetical protein
VLMTQHIPSDGFSGADSQWPLLTICSCVIYQGFEGRRVQRKIRMLGEFLPLGEHAAPSTTRGPQPRTSLVVCVNLTPVP